MRANRQKILCIEEDHETAELDRPKNFWIAAST